MIWKSGWPSMRGKMAGDGFDLEAFLALKKQAERLRREADRSEGRKASLLARLEEEFGLASVQAAERALVGMKIVLEDDEKKYRQLLAEFEAAANGERLGT